MGCNNFKGEDANELKLTCTLNGTQTLVSSLNASNGSTKPSLSTEVKAKCQYENNPSKFSKVKSLAKMCFENSTNSRNLLKILEIFENEVYNRLLSSVMMSDDLNLRVNIDSQEKQFMLIIEADGIRKYDAINNFCLEFQRLSSVKFNYSKFQEIKGFLTGLSALTITFYLVLGESIDCGIGVNKPLDRKSLSEFLSDSPERANISR